VFEYEVQAIVLVCRIECVEEQGEDLDFLSSFFYKYYLVLCFPFSKTSNNNSFLNLILNFPNCSLADQTY